MTTFSRSFVNGLWANNPIFVTVLGICSGLAVTTRVANALVMSLGVTLACIGSALVVSLLRHRLPRHLRLIAYMEIIATVVVVIERAFRLCVPGIAGELGPYVGLIITNCVVMGRIEAFSQRQPTTASLGDALGAGCGYGLVLLLVASVREPLAFGTWCGVRLLPASLPACALFATPAGAFLTMAVLVLAANWLHERT